MAGAQPENMLPILIVLAVMFLGICVAMNLFSRARFKKQRSGVFAGSASSRASSSGQQQRPGSALRGSSPAPPGRKYRASASPTCSSVTPSSRATPVSSIRHQPALADLKDRHSSFSAETACQDATCPGIAV